MADDFKHIGIVLFAEVEELGAIGPWEVLSYWTCNFGQDGYTVSTLSRERAVRVGWCPVPRA
jgi:hypothetical protein